MATRRDLALALWRVIVLWGFLFWQGGFLFYSAVVVPTAKEEIGHLQQGFITRRVTIWLNWGGTLGLALLAIDFSAFPDPRSRRRRWLWATWLVLGICQAALFFLHPRLDAYLDPETLRIGSRPEFRILHRIYLWVHAVQWAFAVALTAQWIASWRERDRRSAFPG